MNCSSSGRNKTLMQSYIQSIFMNKLNCHLNVSFNIHSGRFASNRKLSNSKIIIDNSDNNGNNYKLNVISHSCTTATTTITTATTTITTWQISTIFCNIFVCLLFLSHFAFSIFEFGFVVNFVAFASVVVAVWDLLLILFLFLFFFLLFLLHFAFAPVM